jgi:excinuclease UvrABC nuclease subunit
MYETINNQYISSIKKGDTVTYQNILSNVADFGEWILAEPNLANVPCRPGVYLIVINNDILYVGSAKRLVLRLYKHEYQQKRMKFKMYFIEHIKYLKIESDIIFKIQPPLNKIGVGDNTAVFNGKRYKIQNDKGHKHIIVIRNGIRKKISLFKLKPTHS